MYMHSAHSILQSVPMQDHWNCENRVERATLQHGYVLDYIDVKALEYKKLQLEINSR